MTGRKPTPTNLRVLQGNPSKRPLPKDLKIPAGLPRKPLHLSEKAAELWTEWGAELVASGMLTKADGAAFEELCEARAEVYETRRAKRDAEDVRGAEQFNYEKATSHFLRLLAEFGLTPSSRTRVTPADTSGAEAGEELFA